MALRKVSAVNVLFDLGYLKNYRKFQSYKDYFIEHILYCVQEYCDCIPMNFFQTVWLLNVIDFAVSVETFVKISTT